MEKEFIRVRSVKDIAVFVSLIVLGCILVALPVGTSINIAGGSLAVLGIVLALILKSGYKDADTDEGYFKKEHYFQQEMKNPLLSVIPSMPEVIELSEEDKGNAVIYRVRNDRFKQHIVCFAEAVEGSVKDILECIQLVD